MKLLLNQVSPFSRLVLIALMKKSVKDTQLEIVNPWNDPQDLIDYNPLSQIPSLVAENGMVINGTLAICAYLDEDLFRGPRNAAFTGAAFGILDTFARYFQMSNLNGKLMGDEYLISRCYQGLQRALPRAPELDVNSEDLGQYLLAIALLMIANRKPDLYENHVSASNKAALKAFVEKPLMKRSEGSKIKEGIKTIADL